MSGAKKCNDAKAPRKSPKQRRWSFAVHGLRWLDFWPFHGCCAQDSWTTKRMPSLPSGEPPNAPASATEANHE